MINTVINEVETELELYTEITVTELLMHGKEKNELKIIVEICGRPYSSISKHLIMLSIQSIVAFIRKVCPCTICVKHPKGAHTFKTSTGNILRLLISMSTLRTHALTTTNMFLCMYLPICSYAFL